MLTDEAILVCVRDNLPLMPVRIDTFYTKFALNDKTLQLVDRHVDSVGLQ